MNELLEIMNELRPDIDFGTEKELITGGVFDSLDIVALIEEIKDAFDVDIKPKLITAENFDSIEAIMKLIDTLKTSK